MPNSAVVKGINYKTNNVALSNTRKKTMKCIPAVILGHTL